MTFKFNVWTFVFIFQAGLVVGCLQIRSWWGLVPFLFAMICHYRMNQEFKEACKKEVRRRDELKNSIFARAYGQWTPEQNDERK